MANQTITDFTVRAKSRFEQSFAAYNQKSLTYHPHYVNPQTRRILLEARNQVPEEAHSYVWGVRQKETGRVFRHTSNRRDEMPRAGFNVPALGDYECSLTVKLKNGESISSTKNFKLRNDFLIVVIGDSYASGEGNPDKPGKPVGFDPGISGWDYLDPRNWDDIAEAAAEWAWNYLKREFTTISRAAGASLEMKPPPVWLEKNAHRSLLSGSALAAGDFELVAQGELVTFLTFARSGSEIEAGLIGPRTENGKPIDSWIGNIGQIEEIRRTVGRQFIDALIITIGGNDLGFSGRLKDLVAGDNFTKYLVSGTGDDSKNRDQAEKKVAADLKQLEGKFKKLDTAMEGLNIGKVFLVEYPTGLFDDRQKKPSSGCGIFSSNFDADITAADATVIRDAAIDLNRKLEKIAKDRGWIYVSGIAEGFAGHGYCTGRSTFFVGAEESMVIQGDTDGVMHPNPHGHRVIANQIKAALRILRTREGKPRTGPAGPRKPDGVKVIDHRS